jgi:hypothetical protein
MRKMTLALAAAGLLSLATLIPAATPPAAAATGKFVCEKAGAPTVIAQNAGAARQVEKSGYTCRPL